MTGPGRRLAQPDPSARTTEGPSLRRRQGPRRRALLSVCRVKETVVIEGEATVMTGSLARRLAAAAATRTLLAAPSVA